MYVQMYIQMCQQQLMSTIKDYMQAIADVMSTSCTGSVNRGELITSTAVDMPAFSSLMIPSRAARVCMSAALRPSALAGDVEVYGSGAVKREAAELEKLLSKPPTDMRAW